MCDSRFRPLALAVLFVATASARAQDYERIDVDSLEQPADAPLGFGADISDDGRFVAFISHATNFGGPDVVGTPDLFLRDRFAGTTTRITSAATATPAFVFPCISGDGTKVAFMRGGLTGDQSHAFLHVVSSGTFTEIVVPGLTDIRVNALSLDGRFAVIESFLTSSSRQIHRLDLTNGALVLCSRDTNGNVVEGFNADIDDDGTHVAFTSGSPNLVSGDTNGVPDVFVFDIPGNVMLRASVTQTGGQPSQQSRLASISGDGRYVVFDSNSSNIVMPDTNGTQTDVFLRDMRLGLTSIVSLSITQTQLTFGTLAGAYLSADGSSVAFRSIQPVAPADGPDSPDTFLRDIEPGVLLPSSPGATGTQDSSPLGLTRDGREVLFVTQQPALGAAPTMPRLFVAGFGPRCSSSGYCTSLPSSTGEAASIGAQGDASKALNNLVISAVGLPATANAMLVSGTSAIDPGTPFGNGLLCVGGALIRHGVHVANGGVILDAQNMQSPEYAGVEPGDTRYYQVFYRDPPAGGALFNTTDAVAVTFCW